MVARDQKTVDPGGQEKEKKTVERSAGAGEDTCRCKEVSEMKPRKLLGLVISDLAFWKKAKKG
jgi:hypothetical protein